MQPSTCESRPSIYARVPASFLTGKQTIVLATDHNPTLSSPVAHDISMIRGFVEAHGHRVAKASASVDGFEAEAVRTDSLGGFTLNAHAARGQTITRHAEASTLHRLI